MEIRAAKGELLLALIFAATGVTWIVGALGMPLWEGFAPNSGFLPLIYGFLLTGLSLIILAGLLSGEGAGADTGKIGKPLLVLAALIGAVVGLEVVGFAISIFLMLLVLYAVIERLPILISTAVSAATTAALYFAFKTWLGVPLPAGPIGF
jgi:hypothetical protein